MARSASKATVTDEQDAVRLCQSGDRDAFRLIVERYGNLLYGTAYLMLRDRHEAEDAVQEAFVSGWRAIAAFDVERPIRPWLLRILVNHILQRRRRKLLRLVPLRESTSPIAAASTSPESAAERAWERREVRQALAALPPDGARVVILRFFAQLSVTETAEALGVPEGTVKSRLHRALQRLRDELAEMRGSP